MALADSLAHYGECKLHVLLVDGIGTATHPSCQFWYLSDLKGDLQAIEVIAKYSGDTDKLRWCLKPVFMQYLLQLESLTVNPLIYLDNDLYFFGDYDFLFELLKDHNFILTPHYYRNRPDEKQNWFEANFRVGLYNAGFLGANRNSVNGLRWWAECCRYRCEKSAVRGLFDDQKYLDLLPVVEDKVHVLKHKGCNLAGWNMDVCKREMVAGEVVIDKTYPIVFIHFNSMTIREILKGEDKLLLPYFKRYFSGLIRYKSDLKESDMLQFPPFTDRLKYLVWKFFTETGW